jgi:hypothetical protein
MTRLTKPANIEPHMQSANGARRVGVLAFLLLLLGAAWWLVWRDGSADGRTQEAMQSQGAGSTATPAPMPDGIRTMASPPGSLQQPPPADPFKAALEASRQNQGANPVPPAVAREGTAAPVQDPFRQALEASRQKKPATLSSPFGAQK